MPLKDLEVKNAKPAERPYKLYDGGGLSLVVQPGGSKLWRMKYHLQGKERVLSFGSYPTVGIAAARELRARAKQALAEGLDPMAAKSVAKHAPETTFRVIAKLWHDNRKDSLCTAHAERVWSRIEHDVLPELGNLDIQAIEPPHVLAMIRKIEERGALDISRRAKQSVGQIFQFAIASGLAKTDPTAHLSKALKPRPRVKHMGRVRLAELPELLTRIDGYQEEGARRASATRDGLLFTLLTWVRTSELRFATRDEFEDLHGSNPIWRISAERMKMDREHIVPLSRQAVTLVQRRLRETNGDFLFGGAKPNLPMSENTMIYALYRLGYLRRQTVHGFRSIASTWANEQLIELDQPSLWVRRYHEDWVELQLAHSEEDEVRSAYNAAEYLMPRRRMLQDWADYLDQARMTDTKVLVPAAIATAITSPRSQELSARPMPLPLLRSSRLRR
jgi:integrase